MQVSHNLSPWKIGRLGVTVAVANHTNRNTLRNTLLCINNFKFVLRLSPVEIYRVKTVFPLENLLQRILLIRVRVLAGPVIVSNSTTSSSSGRVRGYVYEHCCNLRPALAYSKTGLDGFRLEGEECYFALSALQIVQDFAKNNILLQEIAASEDDDTEGV